MAGNITPENTVVLSPLSPERTDAPLPVAPPELDPETLRSGLRDFLQELRDAQRERVNMLSFTSYVVIVTLAANMVSNTSCLVIVR